MFEQCTEKLNLNSTFICHRFANIPDIIELDHLTVSGDVTFGRGVSLRVSLIALLYRFDKNSESYLICNLYETQIQGTVIIIANHGDRIDIPAGAILENKIVSGNMRILDH